MSNYSWLEGYQKTWEVVLEETQPSSSEGSSSMIHLRPLLRKFVLILDLSKAALKTDYKPSRLKILYEFTKQFYNYFFSHNPLSSLDIIVCWDGRAHLLNSIDELRIHASGEFSLENSLSLALKILEQSNLHWSKEVVIVQSSLWTCDPGNIWTVLDKCREKFVRISVISLVPEVHVFREATVRTGGEFWAISKESELHEKLNYKARSGKATEGSSLVPMAFPWYDKERTTCACHSVLNAGYICPVCRCKSCKIPAKCPVCDFVLVNSPHLTKAALSLSRLPEFTSSGLTKCSGCELPSQVTRQCPTCSFKYCSQCEDFLRSSLGRCLGCGF